MLNSTGIQNLLKSRDAQLSHNILIYYGADINNTTLLTNNDNSTPLTRVVTVNENKSLALLSDYEVTDEVYRVTLSIDSFPDENAQYWVSFDNGETLTALSFIKYEKHSLGGFYWLFLKKV